MAKKRDEIWDAICGIYSLDPVTRTEEIKIGGIVRDLKLKGATPDEIKIRAKRYSDLYPGLRFFTARALLANWDRLTADKAPVGGRVRARDGKYDGL